VSSPNRVDFYVLAADDPATRLRFTCRLAEKAWLLHQRVHVHATTAAVASDIDTLLWTFRQGSFVPHEVIGPGAAGNSPITIGHGSNAPPGADLLINLADEVPEFFERFPRIAEVIDASDAVRRNGREHFRLYRERGCRPETHSIGVQS